MKDFKRPEFMSEAIKGIKGHHWLYYAFICVVLYFAGSIAESIGLMPAMFGYLVKDSSYQSMIQSGQVDMEKLMNVIMNMPDQTMVLMLYLQAFVALIFILYCRLGENRKLYTMGMVKKKAISSYGKGILFGGIVFCVIYVLCVVSGGIQFMGISENVSPVWILAFLGGYMIQGFTEEIVFRGFLFVSLSKKYTVVNAMILNSILFSAFHSLNMGVSFLAFMNLFLFGIFISMVMLYSENIWMPAAFHAIWNFVQGNVFQIKVSGMKEQVSIFSSKVRPEYSIVTGGDFGIEGGMVTTVVLLVCIYLMYRMLSQKGGIIMWTEKEIIAMQKKYFGNIIDLEEESTASVIERLEREKETGEKEDIEKNVSVKQEEKKVIQPMKTSFDANYFGEKEEE